MHIVIIGAGVSGISTAWQLSRVRGNHKVTLIDSLPPATLASNKGTEAFRSFWPDDLSSGRFTRLLNQSVDALLAFASSHPSLELQQRGYAFFSENSELSSKFRSMIDEYCTHTGQRAHFNPNNLHTLVDGVTFCNDVHQLRQLYPTLSTRLKSMLIFHKCGWLRSAEYIKSMLHEALQGNTSFIRAVVQKCVCNENSIELILDDQSRLTADKLIIAAGQGSQSLLKSLDISLPISYESHTKAIIPDLKGLMVNRKYPFLFLSDPVRLHFSAEQCRSNAALHTLNNVTMNSSLHVRENWLDQTKQPSVQALWTYDTQLLAQPLDKIAPCYGEVLLHGLETLLPGFSVSDLDMNHIQFFSGMYTKLPDNLPCIGEVIPKLVFTNIALSGFGYMFSQMASGLVADCCLGRNEIPDFLSPFRSLDTTKFTQSGQM